MRKTLIFLSGLLIAWPIGAAAAELTIGVVSDGPVERYAVSPEQIRDEIRALLGPEFEPHIPEAKRRNGDWRLAGVREALQRSLDDPQVDVVVTLGLVSSHVAAHWPDLPKPVIAPIVADSNLQRFPHRGDASGKRNFVYLAPFRSVEDELRSFHDIVGFRSLATLVDRLSLDAIGGLDVLAAKLAGELGAQITLVPIQGDVTAALDSLPPDVDAVYVTPLLRLTETQLRALAAGFVERRLPSLSLLGRAEVEAGLLMSASGTEADSTRIARRIALNLQRILLGEPASEIEVSFPVRQRLVINMRTARSLGFSPRWAVLTDADRLFEEEHDAVAPLGLLEAMTAAVESNLQLRDLRVAAELADAAILEARATLLPQLEAVSVATRIDADRANPLVQPENATDLEIRATQLVYSDAAWAGLQITRLLKQSTDQDIRAAALDTLEAAAVAYLGLLRAEALETVRRSDVEVTRTNLELARVRESIGASSRADVLRWESEIARDRQSLLQAEADRRQAATELNRLLARPIEAPLRTDVASLDTPFQAIYDPRMASYIDNPIVWQTFQDFLVEEAKQNSPELASFAALIRAQDRQVSASRRAYYVPQIAFSGSVTRGLSRSGVGADLTGTGLDDDQWVLALQATLPLFTSGALRAGLASARHDLRRLELQQQDAVDRVAARMRAALHRAGSSYPSIELSEDARRAAQANLDLVTDAYSKGALSVTDLVDAQDAALAAGIAAAEARYVFLIDFAQVQRAAGDFDLFLDPASRDSWFGRAEHYFRERGVVPLR